MTTEPGPRHHAVVVGGGFGGLAAALRLARQPIDVTLVDRRNFHLFQPLAYQVATGALSPAEICYPLRRVFRAHRNVRVVLGDVVGIDLAARAPPSAPRRRRARSAVPDWNGPATGRRSAVGRHR